MWLFTTDGFFSTVLADNGEDVVTRARDRESLVLLCKTLSIPAGTILFTPESDYAYRILLTRHQWSQYLHWMLVRMDYRNFKDAALAKRPTDRRWRAFLHDVWYFGWKWQDNAAKAPEDRDADWRVAELQDGTDPGPDRH
jgi:hypothetical protein